MKKSFNTFAVLFVAGAILLGYIGVPAYKMICNLDGHVQHAFFKKDASCEHEKKSHQKSCCSAPIKPVEKQDECCDFETALFKIEDPTVNQESTIQLLPFFELIVFTLFQNENNWLSFCTKLYTISHAPPNVKLRQVALEYISIYRI